MRYMLTPKTYKILREGGKWVITGWSPSDEPIDVYIVYKPEYTPPKALEINKLGYYSELQSNKFWAELQIRYAEVTYTFYNYILIALPLIALLIYGAYGREIGFKAPDKVAKPPCKRKPWLVNLVFHVDSLKIDLGAYYGTLADFYMRNIIDIKEDGAIIIREHKYPLDLYEERVYRLLKFFEYEQITKVGDIGENILPNILALIPLKQVLIVDNELKNIVLKYISPKGKRIMLAITGLLTVPGLLALTIALNPIPAFGLAYGFILTILGFASLAIFLITNRTPV